MKEFELKTVGEESFDDFYTLLLGSFIPEELRSRENAIEVLESPDFILYNICVEGRSVGYISAWRLCGFTFLEHFVMRRGERGKGYGEKAIRNICALHKKLALECEPRDDEIKTRRASFYERCGFVENPIDYVQPSYREGFAEVPLMLMSYPTALESPKDTVKEIYAKVYKKQNFTQSFTEQ